MAHPKYSVWHLTNQRYTYDAAHPETNPRDVALNLLPQALCRHLPTLFSRTAPTTLFEFGCGPGYILDGLSQGLKVAGITHLRVAGIDTNTGYLETAREKLAGIEHVFTEGDAFDSNYTIPNLIGNHPTICIGSHIGYYAYGKKGEDTAQLQSFIDRVQQMLGEHSLGMFIHIINEDIDPLKRKCADIVESDTGKKVGGLLEKQNIKKTSMYFARTTKFPVLQEADWQILAGDVAPTLDATPYDDSRLNDARHLLEFATHKDLGDLTADQRRDYVLGTKALLEKNGYVLNSTVEITLTLPKSAPISMLHQLQKAAKNVQTSLSETFGSCQIART